MSFCLSEREIDILSSVIYVGSYYHQASGRERLQLHSVIKCTVSAAATHQPPSDCMSKPIERVVTRQLS